MSSFDLIAVLIEFTTRQRRRMIDWNHVSKEDLFGAILPLACLRIICYKDGVHVYTNR